MKDKTINGLPPLPVEAWLDNRERLKELLSRYMYGGVFSGGPKDYHVTGEVLYSELAFWDKHYTQRPIREYVKIKFGGLSFTAEITRPNDAKKHRVITYIAFQNARNYQIEEEAVIKRGYAIALFTYDQLFPDSCNDAQYKFSENPPLKKLFDDNTEVKAIAAWAFCASRLLDYLDTTDYAEKNNYIVTGHSRNGKAALCAGIYDDRFKVVVPNNSGCGGCGCFRFLGGRHGLTQDPKKTECLQTITSYFPEWFSKNISQFYDAPDTEYSDGRALNDKLPFDLHFNKALIAPRALLSLEAYGDEWANTYGSRLTHNAAKEVYKLLGVPDNIKIKFREGAHYFGFKDWVKLLDFCDAH